MDALKLELIINHFNMIATAISAQAEGLTSGEVALVAAAIGASAAILAQFVIFFLTRFKEKENLLKELIAEERRLSLLLTESYKELVMHKVHKQYWYRTSEVFNPGTDDSRDSHERHFRSNEKSFETIAEIRVTTSEYFKTVTHFIILTGENHFISQSLSEIKSFKPRKSSDFSQVETYEELFKAEAEEEAELNKVYLYYSDCFDKINKEMINKYK
jgi:hypothetical protein